MAVADVTSVVSADETVHEGVLDTSDILLEDLAADRYARREVSRILATANEVSRLPVAAFNSAI
jgi:hypothetical protein